MNWIQKALNGINPFTKTPTFSQVPVGQMPVYPKAELNTFINAYNNNASLYIIVSMIARKFAYIPRYVYEINDTSAQAQYKMILKQKGFKLKKATDLHKKAYDETVVTDSPLSELMLQPNEDYGQDSYYELLCTYFLLCGEAFEWLNKGLSDEQRRDMTDEEITALPILERVILPSQFMGLIIQRDAYSITGGELTGYQILNNGKPITLRKSEILHWRRPNPNFNYWDLSHFRGFAPLYPLLKVLTQDDSITDASVSMFQNGGSRGAFAGETNLKPEQLSSIDTAIDTKVNHINNKGKIVRVPGKWEYHNFGQSSVDMEMVDAADKVFVKLCNGYGVNPQVFMTATTFNNVEQARADLITNLVLPMCCSLRDEENKMFLPAFGYNVNPSGNIKQRYTTDVDVSGLYELQDDVTKIATSLASAWGLTLNERRMLLNQEELEGDEGEVILVPNNLVTLDDAMMPPETLQNTPYGTGGNNQQNVSDSGGQDNGGGQGNP